MSAALALANGCGVERGSGNGVDAAGGGVADGSSNDGSLAAASDASSCQPADVETYVPGAYRPATAPWQGACTGDQISNFYLDCIGPGASADMCRAFSGTDAATSACAACILTPDSAASYGPLINHGAFISSNVAGCIQLTLASDLSCAKAEEALAGCELAACEANCPVHDPITRAAYDSCASAADGAGCQSYAQMANCTAPLADATPAGACVPSSFKAFYDAVVPLFCALPPQQDAGTALMEAGPSAEGGGDSGAERDGGHDAGRADTSPE